MGIDSFICGQCQLTFHDINVFLKHKDNGCSASNGDQATEDSGSVVTQEVTSQPNDRTLLIAVQGQGGNVELHELQLDEHQNVEFNQTVHQVN